MEKQTNTGSLQQKDKRQIEWYQPVVKRRGEELLKNLAVSAALVLCAVALRAGAVPGSKNAADAVLAATTGDTLLDDQLGKLSFVSRIFPEATLVFGEAHDRELAFPVSGGTLVHAWSREEPYLSWRCEQREVYASMDGVVMGVYHGENEERLVQLMGDGGLSITYGNLKETALRTGDAVGKGESVGVLNDGDDCVLEVMINGVSVDPAEYLASVT